MHMHAWDGCLVHHFLIAQYLFANDVILLASSLEGLQRQYDTLTNVCDHIQMVVSLSKTKVVISNLSKTICLTHIPLQRGQCRDYRCLYLFGHCLCLLGHLFASHKFNLRPTFQTWLNKGCGSLSMLEWLCFHAHFQHISPRYISLRKILNL